MIDPRAMPPPMPGRPRSGGVDPRHRALASRIREANDDIGRSRRAPASQTPRMLATVYDGGHIPKVADVVYLTRPTEVDSDDTEGAAPTFAAEPGQTVPVIVIRGPAVADDILTAYAVGGRWVAQKTPNPAVKTTLCAVACQAPSATRMADTPLVGATITLSDASGVVASCKTGATGCCQVSGLDTGPKPYTVTISDSEGNPIYVSPGPWFIRSGGSYTIATSCCARFCLTLCGIPPSPGCPPSIEVRCGDTVVSSGPVDASGCIYAALPGDGSSCRAYVSGLPPGYTADPAGYPVVCGQVPSNTSDVPADDGLVCCIGLVPASMTLTDPNGSHTFAVGGPGGIPGTSWGCCYVIDTPTCNLSDLFPHDQLAIYYSGSCETDFATSTPVFRVTRTWGVTRACGDSEYAQTFCGGPHPFGGSTGLGDAASADFPIDPCGIFAGAGDLAPAAGNWTADPVGGGIALS